MVADARLLHLAWVECDGHGGGLSWFDDIALQAAFEDILHVVLHLADGQFFLSCVEDGDNHAAIHISGAEVQAGTLDLNLSRAIT